MMTNVQESNFIEVEEIINESLVTLFEYYKLNLLNPNPRKPRVHIPFKKLRGKEEIEY